MLAPGDPLPPARVWAAAGAPATTLVSAAGDGLALLCFYPFDWSPGCTSELRLLKERRADLETAGVRPLGISVDSPWSHRAFAEALALDGLELLSDPLLEAARGCGVAAPDEPPRALRSALLVRDGTVVASWMLGAELPDVDAVIAAASSSSP